jgi:hypothetical protein
MLQVQCDEHGTSAYVDCRCPEIGHNPAVAGVHHPACGFSDLGANVTCPPDAGCCAEDHSHDTAANSCPDIGLPFGERHGKAACPEPPGGCKLWRNMNPGGGTTGPGPCPGGHCHKDIEDCTVCRHLTITVLPGSVAVVPAIGA